MRARFNSELDGNIASLIFKHLSRLDLCLSKAVCRDWWRLISQKHRGKLLFKKYFCETLVEYDRPEYISAVEIWTLFPDKSMLSFDHDIFMAAKKRGAIYSFLLYYRLKRKEVPIHNGIWLICANFPNLWEQILLPVLSLNPVLCGALFWSAVWDAKTDFLDWLYQKRFGLGCCDDYFNDGDDDNTWIDFNELTEEMFGALRHLYTKDLMKKDFWKTYSSKMWKSIYEFWKNSDKNSKKYIDSFLKLIEICKEVPEDACDRASPEEHALFSHLCGCEKVFFFKKRKK
jgi:hypothetical protein